MIHVWTWATNLEEHRQLFHGSLQIQTETRSQESRDGRPSQVVYFPAVKTQPAEQTLLKL